MKKYLSSYWIRSAFYTFLQRFSVTLFGILNFMILVKHMKTEDMGIWALFLVVTTVFEATKTALLKNAHVRFVVGVDNLKDRAAIASSTLIINSAITLLFIGFLLLFANQLSYWLNTGKDLSTMLKWFIPGLIGMVAFSHFEAVQQSHLDFKGGFYGYFARQFIFFLIIGYHAIFKIPFSLPMLALYQSLSIFIGAIILYITSRRYLMHIFNPTKEWVNKTFHFGGFIFGSTVVSNIYQNLDQVMTASIMSPSTTAFYNTASRINNMIDVPSFVAADILFPKSSRASYEEGPAKVKYLYERMVAVLLSVTIPISVFIFIFPKFIINIIADDTYAAAAPILQLYMVAGLLRPMQNQAANLLNSLGKARYVFVLNTVVLLMNLSINWYCLRHFGFYGAAIGTLIALTLGTILWYIVMTKQINFQIGNVFRYLAGFYRMIFTKATALMSR